MSEPDDSLLTPNEIAQRLTELEQDAFPQDRTERLVLDLVEFCRGPAAEQALPRLLLALPSDTVTRLVSKYILSRVGAWDSLAQLQAALVQELLRRKFSVASGGGWSIALPDGTDLAAMLGPAGDEDREIRLCRLALLGAWILAMREHPARPPAY